MGCREVPAQITPWGVTHLVLRSGLLPDNGLGIRQWTGCLALFVGPLMPAGAWSPQGSSVAC